MNPTDLDLNLLVALERLLATGSVTSAARELGVTQPAMSRNLQRLRDALSDPLLVRSGRGLVLTERARNLRPIVAAALEATRRVFEDAPTFDPATARGEVRIALGEEAQTAFADAILVALWRKAPGIDVRIRRLGLDSIDESRRGLLDLAISPDIAPLPASAGRVDLSEFVAQPLYERRFVVVCAPGHPRPPIDLDSYLAADHLVVGPDASGRGFVDDLLAAMNRHRRVAAAVTSFTSGAHVVAGTLLVATLPEEVVRTAGVTLDVHPSPIPLPVLPVLLLWQPQRTADARHRFVREIVSKAVKERMRRAH